MPIESNLLSKDLLSLLSLRIFESYQFAKLQDFILKIRQTFVLKDIIHLMDYLSHHSGMQRRISSNSSVSSSNRSMNILKNSNLNVQNENRNLNRTSQNNSISKHSSDSLFNGNSCKCVNHPNKQASYFGQANQEISYFCQRCAILLASQGFHVEKITYQQIPQSRYQSALHLPQQIQQNYQRKNQIENFLKSVKNLQDILFDKKEDTRQTLLNSQEFYGQQIEEINDYFNLIIQSLQLEKNKCYNYILLERKNAQEATRKMVETIDNVKNDLEQIIQDIQESIDAVYQIDEVTYRPVIENYQIKLQNYEKLIHKIVIQPIQLRKVEFQGVPQSIYSISDVFIKSSTGGTNEVNEYQGKEGNLQYTLQKNDNYPLREITNRHRQVDSQNGSMMFSFEAQMSKNLKEEEALRDYLKMWD